MGLFNWGKKSENGEAVLDVQPDVIDPPDSWKKSILAGERVTICREWCNHYRALERLSIKSSGEVWTGETFSSWLYDMVKKYDGDLLK